MLHQKSVLEFQLCTSCFPSSSQRKQIHDIWRLPQIHGVQRLLRVQPSSHICVPRHGPASHQLLHLHFTQHLPDWRSADRKESPRCLRLVGRGFAFTRWNKKPKVWVVNLSEEVVWFWLCIWLISMQVKRLPDINVEQIRIETFKEPQSVQKRTFR